MSLKEAIQDWWDSRDIRKIRKRRRKKALQYMKSMEKKESNDEKETKDDDTELKYVEKKVTSLKNKFSLKGAFFASTIEKGYKWGLILIGLIVVLISFLLLIIFSSTMFSISSIEYNYEESPFISDKKLTEYVDEYIGENIFLVDVNSLKDKLLENFQTVSKVDVDVLYPKSLLVTLHEYKPALILRKGQSEEDEFLINQAGVVIATRSYSGIDSEYVTVLTTNLEFEATIGDKIMDHNLVQFFYRAESLFEDKVGIHVVSIWWLEREQELHMWTQKYFKVMMTLNRPVEDQINEMIVALQEADIRNRNFEYIDLRIKDKIFVKTR